jgi:6-phosphogluconate dehydrogenase
MQATVGLAGLGTMGSALALNIAEKGFPIAVYNRTAGVADRFAAGAGALADRILPCATLEAFVAALRPPRAVILMVPDGAPVDGMIAALRPLLGPDDLIVDAGNANFHETRRRAAEAEAAGVPFLGVGVSGGEAGARHGPSIMGGGPKAAWDRLAPVLTAIAARFDGAPCATWMGTDGAGHFVKTVHNGVEYADMQMIAEIYGLLRDGYGLRAAEIAPIFARWNEGPLRSYLIEITAEVLRAVDPETGAAMVDVIRDSAGQKGTGRWTAIEALHLGAPAGVIEAAVAARNLSARTAERAAMADLFGAPPDRAGPRPLKEGPLNAGPLNAGPLNAGPLDAGRLDAGRLEAALLAGKICCYAQGFGVFVAASAQYGWDLPLAGIARVWRAGCIIRSALLDEMARALEADPAANLMAAPAFAARMREGQAALRGVVAEAARIGAPVPALSAALGYFDTLRARPGTANLIQAQRDYFGAHGFERIDAPGGGRHGPWAGHDLGPEPGQG